MHKQMWKRTICLVLVFFVSFFAVYVQPLEVDALAGSILIGGVTISAKALYAGTAVLVAGGLTFTSNEHARVATMDFFKSAGASIANDFNNMLVVSNGIGQVTNAMWQSVKDWVSSNFNMGINSNSLDVPYTLYNHNEEIFKIFRKADNVPLSELSVSTVNIDGSICYAEMFDVEDSSNKIIYTYKDGERTGYKFASGLTNSTEVYTGIFNDPYGGAFYRMHYVFEKNDGTREYNVFPGTSNFNALGENYISKNYTSTADETINDINRDWVSTPVRRGVVLNPGGNYAGRRPNEVQVNYDFGGGNIPSPSVPNNVVKNELPLFVAAALTSFGITYTGDTAYQDYWYTGKALEKMFDVMTESNKVARGSPFAEYKFYPNGIPPDPPEDKPPKWNPFKLPDEPPWKAAKYIMAGLAWVTLQKVSNLLHGDDAPLGVSDTGEIVFDNNIQNPNALVKSPYYTFDGHKFKALPSEDGNTYLYDNDVLIGSVPTSGADLSEGFIVVADGNDAVLKYKSQSDSEIYNELDLGRIIDGLDGLHDMTGSAVDIITPPEIVPSDVLIETNLDKQLDLGHADVIVDPDDDRYEYVEAVANQIGSVSKTLVRLMDRFTTTFQNGLKNITETMTNTSGSSGTGSPPGTALPPDFDDGDTDDNNNPLTLILVFWRLLLACINLMLRAILFVVSLGTIPADSSFVNEYIMLGINYFRNIDVYGKFTIWSALQSVFTAVYALMIVKIVSRNYGRL